MKKTIGVIVGTTRKNRSSELIADWVIKNTPDKEGFELKKIDLRDWQLPFFDEAIPPLASKGQYEGKVAQEWSKMISELDGLVLITGEYNHSIPAVLKNALDYLYSGAMAGKPVSFVSYGATSGGIRAVEHLRQVVLELRMIPMHDEVNIPFIWEAFNEDGSIKNQSHVNQLHATLSELTSWMERHS